MKQTLIIVDDFYTDPHAIRETALSFSYEAKAGHTYPGENSVEALSSDAQLAAFQKILGPNITFSEEALAGQFRISKASDSFDQDIHVDPHNDPNKMIWAAVVYLNTPEQCRREDGSTRDGTLLWRHKELNVERVPRTQAEGEALGLKDYDAVRQKFLYEDGHDRDKWELMHRIPMRFNRVAFFRPYHWHSHGENFGSTREDARLVQIFFFDKV